jgi:uridine phosphorylase
VKSEEYRSVSLRPDLLAPFVLCVIVFCLLSGSCGDMEKVRSGHISDLENGSAAERIAAAKALGSFNNPRAIRALIIALEDPDKRVQRTAIASLAQLGAPAVLELVAELKGRVPAIPLLGFEEDSHPLLEPFGGQPPNLNSSCAVVCFFPDVIHRLVNQGRISPVFTVRTASDRRVIYRLEYNGLNVLVVSPETWAPAAAAALEELIAVGVEKVVAVAGADVLHRKMAIGDIIVPVEAIRDEGVSHYYLAPGERAIPSRRTVDKIKAMLTEQGISFQLGTTWTTDSIYHRTLEKLELRQGQGCLVSETVISALFTVASKHSVDVGAILYGISDLTDESSGRDWSELPELRMQLFWLAADVVVSLDEPESN